MVIDCSQSVPIFMAWYVIVMGLYFLSLSFSFKQVTNQTILQFISLILSWL